MLSKNDMEDAMTTQANSRWPISLVTGFVLIIGLIGLIVAIVLPINQLTQPGGSVAISLDDPTPFERVPVSGLPDGTHVEVDTANATTLEVFELPWYLRLLTEAGNILEGLALAYGAYLLGLVLRTVEEGKPFDRANPRRLTALAVVALIGGAAPPLLALAASAAVRAHVGLTAEVGGPPVEVGGLAAFVLLLVVAYVFRRGTQLADDVEGLV
jgi:hypothetical protein